MAEPRLYEDEHLEQEHDPDESPTGNRRLFTQPYDLVITALLDQIRSKTLHLRPISDRPTFQRRYVWSNRLASKLIESILLNVPIPPCYLAQNEEFELDVIDGQQRIYSIYRFSNNEFRLTGLEVLKELNGSYYYEIPKALTRKIDTYTLRCVIVTNDSDAEIKFEVFERLNTSTMPLNAQELRNSISRGQLIDLLNKLVDYKPWLGILNRRQPDRRMRDEEMILRFFAFHIGGLNSYKTPQKHWLNDAAKDGRKYSDDRIENLATVWKTTVDKCLLIFKPQHCFRRLPLKGRSVVNRALMDLTMYSLNDVPVPAIKIAAKEFHQRYINIVQDEQFDDLITRAIDHKTRTIQRFEIWSRQVTADLF